MKQPRHSNTLGAGYVQLPAHTFYPATARGREVLVSLHCLEEMEYRRAGYNLVPFNHYPCVDANGHQPQEKAIVDGIEVHKDNEDIPGHGQIESNPVVEYNLVSGDPLPEDPVSRDRETRQCTIRSIVVGSFFGLLIGAANLYVSYKTGFSMDAGPFAVFAGFGVLKLMQNNLPRRLGGGFFGPKENVTCQSAANGANSGIGIFAAAYILSSSPPLMYQGPCNVFSQASLFPQGGIWQTGWARSCMCIFRHVFCHPSSEILHPSSTPRFSFGLCRSNFYQDTSLVRKDCKDTNYNPLRDIRQRLCVDHRQGLCPWYSTRMALFLLDFPFRGSQGSCG